LIVRQLLKDRDGPVGAFVSAVMRVTGYEAYWKTKSDKDGSRDPYQNLGQLMNLAADFDRTDGTGLGEFLSKIALMTDHDRIGIGDQAVSLMTLYISKGLEFDTVFLLGVEEELLPHSMSLSSLESLEEERRLLHVGMTRAMRHLTLSHATERSRFGRRNFSLPSRFLQELPDEHINTIEPPLQNRFFAPSAAPWDEDREAESDHPLAFLRTGSPVWHPEWGRGRVRDLRGRGHPLDRKGLIQFDDGSLRQVILRHSSLEPLEEECD
jgi:DNA helicase-2/ATP-dependent DNA helicase PcrA